METIKKNYKLNILKGIACICVVFIHVPFPGKTGEIVGKLSGYAVPIFFMIAGYYAYHKDVEVIKRRFIKIIRILIVAYFLYFFSNATYALSNHNLLEWLAEHFDWKTPIKYIVFCSIDFAIPLWYLIAMAETYIFWYLIVRKRYEKSILKFVPIFFALQIIITLYCETMGLPWSWKINFISRALPWFLTGYYLHTDDSKKIREIKTINIVVILLIGALITVIPTIFELSIEFSVIGYIPYAFGLFVLALKKPNNRVCKPIEFIGDSLSLYIYILHPLIRRAVDVVVNLVLKDNWENTAYVWYRPMLVLLVTMIISYSYFLLRVKMIESKKYRSKDKKHVKGNE